MSEFHPLQRPIRAVTGIPRPRPTLHAMRFSVVCLMALFFSLFTALGAVETTSSTVPVPVPVETSANVPPEKAAPEDTAPEAIPAQASETTPDATPAPEIPAQLVDRSIRYVSGKVLTLGDLVDHLQNNRPKENPTTQAGVSQLWRDALERLTDETLLVLFAEEKGVALDRTQISRKILDDLKASGRLLPPDEVARWRDQMIRREMIRAALSFFDQRSGNVTPDELLAAYAERRDSFRRPARAQVLQFVLRATSDEEIAALGNAYEAWFRKLQEKPGPLADLAAARLNALLAVASDPEQKNMQLVALAGEAAALDPAGWDKRSLSLRDEAAGLGKRRAAQQSHADIATKMDVLHADLKNGDEAAFRTLVKAQSQGPRREDGGDLGWIERGSFTAAFDDAVFSGPVGGVGEPFWVAEACCLTWVVARDDAKLRSFAEVCGELESTLRRERTDEVFARAAGILRQRSTIRDLASIDELLSH